MTKAQERDLANLKRIEEAIQMILMQCEDHKKVNMSEIQRLTGSPYLALAIAVKLHYLKEISKGHYSNNLEKWEPIHYRNILNGIKVNNSKYNSKRDRRVIKTEPKPKVEEEKTQQETLPVELEILNAIAILRRLGCTGIINISIKL